MSAACASFESDAEMPADARSAAVSIAAAATTDTTLLSAYKCVVGVGAANGDAYVRIGDAVEDEEVR